MPVLQRWPTEEGAPDRSTLSRWLKRATAQGVICCSGSGYRGDPFVYWLPGREPLLWPGDKASDEAKQSWRDRLAAHGRTLRSQVSEISPDKAFKAASRKPRLSSLMKT